jgi:hypothetical protein
MWYEYWLHGYMELEFDSGTVSGEEWLGELYKFVDFDAYNKAHVEHKGDGNNDFDFWKSIHMQSGEN